MHCLQKSKKVSSYHYSVFFSAHYFIVAATELLSRELNFLATLENSAVKRWRPF